MKLELRDLHVERGGQVVLAGLDLTLDSAATLVVAGPSGAGKSTMLAAILGLVGPVRGGMWIDGEAVDATTAAGRAALWPKLGWVPQRPGAALPARWSIAQSVAHPLRLRGVGPAAAAQRADAALRQVGLDETLSARAPHRLSGGQQQRAVIARALVLGAALLLLDEPSSALDPAGTDALAAVLLTLQRDHGMSLLVVSHDVGLARALDAPVMLLARGRAQSHSHGALWWQQEQALWQGLARETI